MSWGPFDLSGKSAIVTGGAMGIGFGIVKRFGDIANVAVFLASAASDYMTGELVVVDGGTLVG